MNKLKTLKGAALVVATSMLPLSQAAMADVSISGWMNESLTFYDDGTNSDAVSYGDNGNTLGTRLTFSASSEVSAGLTAGMEIIFEPQHGGLGWGTLGYEDETVGKGTNRAFSSNLHVGGAWGKITAGTQSMPTDNIAVLEDPSLTLWAGISPVFHGNGAAIQSAAGGVNSLDGTTGAAVVWGDFMNCFTAAELRSAVGIGIDCNGIYRQGIRYDLPAFGPVSIAIGYANDDVYDISAKWKGSLGRMAGSVALGYAINQGPSDVAFGGLVGSDQVGTNNPTGAPIYSEAENFQIQAGLMDPVTGLFGSIAYQHESADLSAAATMLGMEDETDAWWMKIGIQKQWFSAGNTTIAFDYGQYNDQYGADQADDGVTGSEVERIGVGVTQHFGGSLQIYGKWQQLDLDVDGAGGIATYGNIDELDTFQLGGVYFF